MIAQFIYNPEMAIKAGQSSFISETGAYVGKITNAYYIQTQKGALALELSFESQEGLKADYLSLFYQSGNGNPIVSGHNMIQAIMGCVGVKQLSTVRQNGKDDIAPELTGKAIGLVLQKVLYTKNNGQDGYRFQIVCPFIASTGQTLAEQLSNRPPQRVEQLKEGLKTKDERDKTVLAQAQQEYYKATTPPPIPDPFIETDLPF